MLGSYIRVYGSTEGVCDVLQARGLNSMICKQADDDGWQLPPLHASAIAWWIAEYSGLYAEDQLGGAPEGVDLDEGASTPHPYLRTALPADALVVEDRQRSKQFTDSLKAGAFDFMLAVAADVKTVDWQDPTRRGVQQWLQRKSPPLPPEAVPFSDYFQTQVMEHLEFFIDAFISNLPDVLRRLRVEEDEQRQLSQTHEQDLDLERFLLIISYSYGGRPQAAEAFWSDPDSNLAGFMHWASRRASTPLVSAFCEMLQSISENETCADSAHAFLLDDGHLSSGKMRRSLSLTWNQIFKELEFFTTKIRDRAAAPQLQTYRAGKPSTEQSETEPESAVMLECYLRLISKLATNSHEARQWLLRHTDFALVPVLFQLASLPIPSRLRACAFYALKALLSGKSQEEGFVMWNCLDGFMTGGYSQQAHASHRSAAGAALPPPSQYMESLSQELSRGFEQANAFVQFLLSLIAPLSTDAETVLHDSLPFPETLGSAVRIPGIEPYVDFVLGEVFSSKPEEAHDVQQLRVLRLSCLEFVLTCLETFNEDLILIGNETNIAVDAAIPASDLATYVRLHPFARVMEWMFDPDVVQAIFDTVHQDSSELGSASPDSPLILGIIRAVEVISKVLDLQDTYLDLVRQVVRAQPVQRGRPIGHSVYASFEEGIMNHLDLIVDLGRCCNLGHPALTLGCLKLLEKISTSSRIVSAWNPSSGRQSHRNKAIVALEKNNAAAAIAGSFVSDLLSTLDLSREAEAPNFLIKIYILEFLHACLRASPNQPTIAHLLLGFQCAIGSLSAAPGGAFESRSSLFHNLLRVLLEAPFGDDAGGMRHWLITLKCKAMRVLQALWSSPLSSALVLGELRENEFLFHLLLREVTLEPELAWDGASMENPQFLGAEGAMALIEYLELRAMELEYLGMELCSVSQNRLPHLKRRIFDALNGRVVGDDGEPISTPTIFGLYDFLFTDDQWENPVPTFTFFKDLDLRICLQDDATSTPMYNMDLVREILQLKRAEVSNPGVVVTKEQDAAVKEEEANLNDYLILSNRQRQLEANRLKVLRSWSNLLLVMSESDESDGAARAAFLLQGLQIVLPNLEAYGAGDAPEAYELARLAKVLLFKLDLSPAGEEAAGDRALGDLMSEKLFQLFQISLYAIVRWAGNPELRAVYYSICYRYVTGIVDEGRGFLPGRQKTIKAIQLNGERLLNVICDDAYGGDVACQTAALILLGALVKLGHHEDDTQVVDTLNRLNFIGVLVDSLKTVMQEGLETIESGSAEQRQHQDAKLALLLQLCQTRGGAAYVLHANLFRAIELSGLFSADPELQIGTSSPARAPELPHKMTARQLTRETHPGRPVQHGGAGPALRPPGQSCTCHRRRAAQPRLAQRAAGPPLPDGPPLARAARAQALGRHRRRVRPRRARRRRAGRRVDRGLYAAHHRHRLPRGELTCFPCASARVAHEKAVRGAADGEADQRRAAVPLGRPRLGGRDAKRLRRGGKEGPTSTRMDARHIAQLFGGT